MFLSTIATLSTIIRTPVRMTHVAVSDGGIQSHDMRVLQLLRKICNGTLAANTGLSTVTYIPGELLNGNFSAEAGRLGYVAKKCCFPKQQLFVTFCCNVYFMGLYPQRVSHVETSLGSF